MSAAGEALTGAVLRQALTSVGVPPTDLRRLKLEGGRKQKQINGTAARDAFLRAAATPEQRLELAKTFGGEYAEWTNWVVRAHLMQLGGAEIDAAMASLLASTGVAGASDLLNRFRQPDRVQALRASIEQQHPATGVRRRLEALFDRLGDREQGAALPPPVITDVPVILVVKGAGVQKPDETLDLFLEGFWPALKRIDPEAQMAQRHDIFPPAYRSSPHDADPHNHVTEMQTGERRVWVKEVFWEAEVLPPSPLKAASEEWQMATVAFAHTFYDTWSGQLSPQIEILRKQVVDRVWTASSGFASRALTRAIGNRRMGQFSSQVGQLRERFVARLPPAPPPQPSFLKEIRGYLGHYAAISYTYLLALAPILVLLLRGTIWTSPLALLARTTAVGLILISLVAAAQPAFAVANGLRRYRDKREPFERFPGMGLWVMVLLAAAVLFDPVLYLAFLLALLVVELTLLHARARAWNYRADPAGDMARASPQAEAARDGPAYPVWAWLGLMIYRYIVVMTLPFAYFFYLLARALRATRVLEWLGDWVDNVVSVTLSGFLGDVVGYAMDPAHAHRVQSLTECDIRFFLDRPEVSSLHVFAHSLGTVITYETLFHHLPEPYCSKIKTYVTIGSVLSYFNQTNSTMDRWYIPRFPAPSAPRFAKGFRWLNFWNLLDPITEFYGLREEYLHWQPVADGYVVVRPEDIKTHATAQNHGEYWTNVDQIHRPFARRVLGEPDPQEWAFRPDEGRGNPTSHALYLTLWWVAGFLSLIALGVVLNYTFHLSAVQSLLQIVAQFVQDKAAAVAGAYKVAFPPPSDSSGTETAWLTGSLSLLQSESVRTAWTYLALAVNVVMLGVTAFYYLVVPGFAALGKLVRGRRPKSLKT